MKLKEFEQIKTPLLKEWEAKSEEEYKRQILHIYNIFKSNINKNLIYERGEAVPSYDSEWFYNPEQLERVFGLPYTSTGDFAAIWNTNTQARAKYGEAIYFRGIAYSEKKETVLIFEQQQKNDFEKYFYFYEYEFYNYQEFEEKKQAAKDWGEFVKASNKIKNKTLEILNQYKGKPYGQKTAEKIHNEIRETAQDLGVHAWLTNSQYLEGLEIKKNTYNKKFYFDFLDNENKITEPKTQQGKTPEDLPQFDSLKEFETKTKLEKKIKEKASEFLKLIEEYNKHADRINARPKATQSLYNIDVERLKNGDFDK